MRVFSQNNLEKDVQNHNPWFQTIRQSYSNENSIAVAQKETHTSMEQNRKFRNKPTVIRAINYVKQGKIIQWGKDSFIYKWWWESQKATCKRIISDYSLEPYKKLIKNDLDN